MPWYKTIEPKDELKTLGVRQKLDLENMRNQQARVPASHTIENFTPLSAFQYLASGTQQHFFTKKESDIGIVIWCDDLVPRNVFWRDSGHCSVSDYIFKKPLAPDAFQKALKDYEFVNVQETEISSKVKDRYDKLRAQYRAERLKESKATLGWTEGLFRYQASEIDGVVVNPENFESCQNGYAFLKVIEGITKTTKQFCWYDATALSFKNVRRDEVERKINPKIAEYEKCYMDAASRSK